MKILQKILGIGVLTAGLTSLVGKSDAEQIFIQIKDNLVSQPIMRIDHRAGATEGYDSSYDSTFLSGPSGTPTIDFFSNVSFDPYRLKTDARSIDSFSTINEEIIGRELSGSVNGSLKFTLRDYYSDNAFANKNIFADLYSGDHASLLGTFDVKDYAANGITIPITVNNGLSYTMDVRFTQTPEPPTGKTAAIAALAGLSYAGARMFGERYNRKRNLRLENRRATGRVA
jgi:hypothetical protein